MSYSPVSKSNKSLSDDELYNLRCSIYNKYRDAILSNNYSGYNSAYKDYLHYVENGGTNHYLSVAMRDYRFQYKKQQKIEKINTTKNSFVEMSYEEKIKFVNKEIDDLLNFIERNKQARYNAWKEEFYNGTRLR